MKIQLENVIRFAQYVAQSEKSFSDKINFLLENNAHQYTCNTRVKPTDYFELISGLSATCPSTALSFSMHLYTQWGMKHILPNGKLDEVMGTDIDNKKLFGSLNEPGIYFVRENQLIPDHFVIHAKRTKDGYLVNGVKKFVSLEPFVHFLPVYCYVDNPLGHEARIAILLIRKSAEGICIEEDWDTISMTESYSNSVRFHNVHVPHDDVLLKEKDALQKTNVFAYLYRLSIVSVYYGIAKKAYQFVLDYCKEKQVPHTNRTLSFFPGVQFSVAEISILLEGSRSQIIRYCELLKLFLEGKPSVDNINIVSLMAKEIVVKNAEQVVNLAMKIVGISSITNGNVLSKLYQDVKAGQFHPPQYDVAYEMIAKHELGVLTHRTRWL
ncbi:acyl-CoA dehydrogenase family protein [Paenibacillus sp. GCM10012307]|uniref:Acyl-CoA/acyl-ACP dehydrogenase n=1 Tax=Paenibacillus roseus TaxID=2798579 RepID=A0A934MPN1_9BACL|nr:acyl-CoA dehydrogenase family protein [Paenibacillus roseus]MBJ6360579.1 acyl-CoA/acyl-ACP dehydrogenase [Paenibacillus roseus]